MNGWYVRDVLVHLKIICYIKTTPTGVVYLYIVFASQRTILVVLYLLYILMKKVSRAQAIRIIALLLLVFLIAYPLLSKEKAPVISSFQECIDAGYPIMESYPRQCKADGNNFVEEITPSQEPWQTQEEGEQEAVFCTMDAKVCPDGSYVGRQWPDCTFAPCPGE